ncbi:DUF3592 domain-containing protein [Pseudomonas sp. RIT-PI-S]|uniref:DUF3592 domain-containing protein n=1 Tax=Pseudomonas sp. RIT-PI-S TaxID=3035295 RepID=UPI0021DA6722|nr:DUF3592 domain-containing protein [Pseudomonas sp. RIT-PI-S]
MYYPREAERDNLYTRVILLTLACIVLLGIAAMARRDGSLYSALQLSAVDAAGTVTRIEWLPRNSRAAIIQYRYSDSAGEAHEGEYVDAFYSEDTQYTQGGPVQLVYSGWFPSMSSIAEHEHRLRPGFYIMAGGVLTALVLLGICGYTLGRIGRMTAEDVRY